MINGNVLIIKNGTGILTANNNNTSIISGNYIFECNNNIGSVSLFTNGTTTIGGNFSHTDNLGATTTIGNSTNQTLIDGKVDVNYNGNSLHNPFVLNLVKNLTSGGSVTILNPGKITNILKDTLITDAAVEHMLKFKGLKNLFLRRHDDITKASIPFFNQMENLESLNITKTGISLSDLSEGLNNQSLKQVFLSSEEDEKDMEEKAFILKERMPNCDIYLDASDTIDVFGNPEKPIF